MIIKCFIIKCILFFNINRSTIFQLLARFTVPFSLYCWFQINDNAKTNKMGIFDPSQLICCALNSWKNRPTPSKRLIILKLPLKNHTMRFFIFLFFIQLKFHIQIITPCLWVKSYLKSIKSLKLMTHWIIINVTLKNLPVVIVFPLGSIFRIG